MATRSTKEGKPMVAAATSVGWGWGEAVAAASAEECMIINATDVHVK